MPETHAEGGLSKANELVEHFGRTRGAIGAKLDSQYDRSFGECGFRYNVRQDVLTGRVLLGKAFRADEDDESKNNVRKVVQALNDPVQLQGTFELLGGRIVLDETSRMLFLVKDFPLRSTTASSLRNEMEVLLELGAIWELRWLAWAGAIVHRHLPPPGPPLPVTRANERLHKEPRPY